MIMSDDQLVVRDSIESRDVVKKVKRKKIPLEEDEFTDVMRKIIRRDYFPDIDKHEAQLAYIEATESNDPVKLREISERYSTDLIQTPSAQTPSTWVKGNQRDSLMPPPVDPPTKLPKPEDSGSLDTFLSRYHSEDDAAFGEIMEREEIKRKEKSAWLYERESLAHKPPTQSITSRESMLSITDGSRGSIEMWKYTPKNTLMYIPEGVELSPAELMKRGQHIQIKSNNTRLSKDFIKHMAESGTPSDNETPSQREKQLMKEKIGVDGKQIGVTDTPNIQGYGFVATPQINPGVDASPLMTWGSIDGTPLHIDADVTTATPGQVFKIPKESVRDNIGIKLANAASKSQREKKKVAMAQATSTLLGTSPRLRSPHTSPSSRLRLLSPAARKLIRQSSSSSIRGDRSLRASYNTPTRAGGHTPKNRGGHTPKSTSTLTDDLLHLK